MAPLDDQRGRAQPLDIRDFIFVRELAEVYLLLDHISGRWDKPLDADADALIGAICAIGWPPAGQQPDAAQQAATLLRAKDRLNALARPASGATIAFTLLVVGEEDPRRRPRRWWRRWWPGNPRLKELCAAAWRGRGAAADPAPLPDVQDAPAAPRNLVPPFTSSTGQPDLIAPGCGFTRPPTRMSLARTAFPGLIGPAGHFNRGIWRIVLFLVLWMVLTCVLSWDITAGNVVLTHLDTLRTQQAELARKISAAEAADELARRTSHANGGGNDAAPLRFCDPLRESLPRPYRTVEEQQLCTEKERLDNERLVTQRNLQVWLRPWAKLYGLEPVAPAAGAGVGPGAGSGRGPGSSAGTGPGSASSPGTGSRPGSASNPGPGSSPGLGLAGPVAAAVRASGLADRYGGDEEPARVLTHVIGCAVLPLCYGILGAGAAAVRNLWAKLRESLLMPRDYTLALGQLALGATIGACIGLFVNPSGAAPGADAALATSWTLSGSALSFIAGFGVEGVFLALEAFVRRVFGVPGQGEGPPGR